MVYCKHSELSDFSNISGDRNNLSIAKMWIQVRSMDGKTLVRIDGLSKLTKVDDLREKLVEPFEAPTPRQRLFYRGKQLENGHTLFDYNVGLNEIIQIMVRPDVPVVPSSDDKDDQEETLEEREPDEEPKPSEDDLKSQENGFQDMNSTYKMGDIVDIRDPTMGCWFEARLSKITLAKDEKEEENDAVKKEEEKMETEQNNNNNNVKSDSDKILQDSDSNKLTNGSVNNQNDANLSDSDKENEVCDSDKENKPTSETSADVSEKKLSNGKLSLEEEADDEFMYHVVFDGYEDDDIVKVRSRHIRPRARNKLSLGEAELGAKVMVNYNYDSPTERGYWYDAIITGKRDTRTMKELQCTVFIGADLIPMEDCKVIFCDEIFKIEKPGTQQNLNDPKSPASSPVKRQNKPECDHCLDNPRKKCKHCACHKCGDKKDPDKQLMCDECDNAFHLYCLDPPLDAIPDVEEWYCPMCKNDETEVVRAGEKLKASKKKAKMASATSSSSRDWGRGMACVGRTKMCHIVPPNHFGPIPGIEVGMAWKFRVQASEAGVHRPHVAGIHGKGEDGAYSIVLSGGYEDDKDDGEQFTYTGSGGRDLSGNKRTAEQSSDQLLTRMNRALAKNCNATIDNKKGAEASNWKAGKPVRVIRNCKGRKHSKYAPEEGNRYDGIYKIAKYWPEKGQSGFLVWRYLLKRDDPSPAPWTKAGKKRIAELGLTMQFPEGYLEQQKEKEEKKAKETPGKEKKGKRKRVIESDEEEEEKPAKKKAGVYKVSEEVSKLIKEDSANEKVWKEVLEFKKEGAQQFLAKVEETFLCVCCQEIVYKPITTTCLHNICKSCLQRSFKADVYCCPFCRNELGKEYSMASNKVLSQIMLALFPGYDSGRA